MNECLFEYKEKEEIRYSMCVVKRERERLVVMFFVMIGSSYVLRLTYERSSVDFIPLFYFKGEDLCSFSDPSIFLQYAEIERMRESYHYYYLYYILMIERFHH